MDGSGNETVAADAKAGRRGLTLAFDSRPPSYKSRSSTGSIPLRKDVPALPTFEIDEKPELDVKQRPAYPRSRSIDVTPRVRQEWGDELWEQEALRKSAETLRSSVADYEEVATRQQWKELLGTHADFSELEGLANALKTKKSKGIDDERLEGLTKFTAVALEYSKMLDVVMNQSPEYASLAWGAIRLLLVAHTNHSKLKGAVEHYLVAFGQEFGLVNQLMNYHPTKKMVEAVSSAYICFSKFLAKAVGYYKESKLKSAIKALAFPWETQFQHLVQKLEQAFQRIREIAHAGHFSVAVQTHQMIDTISFRQEKIRHEMHQGTLDLRQQLKEEMRNEVQSLFNSFDRNWITRFEHIMLHSVQDQAAAPIYQHRSDPKSLQGRLEMQNGQSMTIGRHRSVSSTGTSYLADFVSKPKRLRRFRDRSFPFLQRTDRDEATLNVRLRHVTTWDLQQITGLLKNETIRSWLQSSSSSLIWVNTYRQPGPADWTTAFSTRMVEQARKIEHMMVLYHLCGNHSTSDQVSTPTVFLQSLIMQILQQHHKRFLEKAFPFTLEHFRDVNDDFEELWNLFSICCDQTQVPCIWLVIDHINNLQSGEDYDELLLRLQMLTEGSSGVVKIFLSARACQAPPIFLEAANAIPRKVEDCPLIATINVPRAQLKTSVAFASKQKHLVRVPDLNAVEKSPVAKADITALLESSEEDLSSNMEEEDNAPPVVHLPSKSASSSKKRHETMPLETSDLSDSSMEFSRTDPFATSDESDLDETRNRTPCNVRDTDSEEEKDPFFPSSRAHHHENPLLSSSEDDTHLAVPDPSRRKSRGRSNGSFKQSNKRQIPRDLSTSDSDPSW